MISSFAPAASLFVATLLASSLAAAAGDAIDYMSIAEGTVPLRTEDSVAVLGTGFEQAIAAIDGNTRGFALNRKPAAHDTVLSFVYVLPAETVFTEFRIPGILETPSPSQTFAGHIAIEGSATGPDGDYELLASADLAAHATVGLTTSLPVARPRPARWIRLTLTGGLDMPREKMFYEFSELIGLGQQAYVPPSTGFTGVWKARGVLLELKQEGLIVSGCYDRSGELEGSVHGNVLRATGRDRNNGTVSSFVLTVADDDQLLGVRSSNGAPFRLYTAPPAPTGTVTACTDRKTELPGCNSTVYGVRFDFDSARLTPEAEPILDALYRGLEADAARNIVIIGHTSSEGSVAYNRRLSRDRAAAVVEWLAGRGIARERLSSSGRGEDQPIAPNNDEAGRAINRRVEVVCR